MRTFSFYGTLLTIILIISSCTESDPDVFGQIYGRVTNAADEPLSGASVNLSPKGNTVVTGEDGTFEFKNLETGKYEIQVSKAGYKTVKSSVTVKASIEIQHDIRLYTESFSGIFGYVRDEETKTSVPGASVTLDPTGRTVLTDNNGRYEFKDPEPGNYSLVISKSGYQTYTKTITAESGKAIQSDILLYVGIGYLRIDDPVIKFGKSDLPLACNIRNVGSNTLSWEIQPYSYEWIQSVSPMKGELISDGKASIIISVDRTKLINDSPQTAKLFIESEGKSSVITITINAETSGGGDDDDDEIVVSNNLVAYYNFDNDQLSPDLIDNSGNNNEARIVHNPLFTEDTPNGKGKAISLKASNSQYINIRNPFVAGIEKLRVKNYSINFWIKDFGSGMVYSLVSNYVHESYPYLFFSSNTVYSHTISNIGNNADQGSFGNGINDYINGKWHMMTYTYFEGLQTFYIDGKVYNTIPKKGTANYQEQQSYPFQFGGNARIDQRTAMDMKLDNIRFYNRELSQEEIKTIYNKKQ